MKLLIMNPIHFFLFFFPIIILFPSIILPKGLAYAKLHNYWVKLNLSWILNTHISNNLPKKVKNKKSNIKFVMISPNKQSFNDNLRSIYTCRIWGQGYACCIELHLSPCFYIMDQISNSTRYVSIEGKCLPVIIRL